MIFLSSPAKTQDFETPWQSEVQTNPEFLSEAANIVKKLQSLSVAQLAKVLQVSKPLAELNYTRYQSWSEAKHQKIGKPSILAYNGDIFKQMKTKLYTKEEQAYTQHSLRVLTGLYGMIRAYDLMLPYRLEMKAVVAIGTYKDLNQYWAEKLTASLKRDLTAEKKPLLVDLASGEYSKPINFKEISVPWVRIEFRENEPGGIRNVGLFSKKARGMMVEYLIKKQATTIDDIKGFTTSGYKFESEKEHELMFVRKS